MRKKVLIIDDDPTMQRLAKDHLETEGFNVAIAGNGLEGLHYVRNNMVDAIVLDIIMPVMDGIDFFKAMKASPATANIPVVVVTQKKVIEDSFRYLGVNDFLSKPTDKQKLLEKVNKVLGVSGERHHLYRVLLAGNEKETLREMADLLSDAGSYTKLVYEGGEAISQALVMVPDVLLLDVFIRDYSSHEIVKAIRSFHKLNECRLFIFNSLSADEIGSKDMLASLDSQLSSCLDNGANGYLGRYNRLTFLETFNSKFKAGK